MLGFDFCALRIGVVVMPDKKFRHMFFLVFIFENLHIFYLQMYKAVNRNIVKIMMKLENFKILFLIFINISFVF